jgi:hypothetical protein
MKKMLIAALILPVALLGAARPARAGSNTAAAVLAGVAVGVGVAVILDALIPRPVVAAPAVVYPPPAAAGRVSARAGGRDAAARRDHAGPGGVPDAAASRRAQDRDREGGRGASSTSRIRSTSPGIPTGTGRSATSPSAKERSVSAGKDSDGRLQAPVARSDAAHGRRRR